MKTRCVFKVLSIKIAIAERNQGLRKKLARLFEEQGYDISQRGVDASLGAHLKEYKPDVVVGGVVLDPKSEDFAVFRDLTEKKYFASCPLILLTEIPIPEKPGLRKRKHAEIDCDAYCNKPVDRMELLQKVRKLAQI